MVSWLMWGPDSRRELTEARLELPPLQILIRDTSLPVWFSPPIRVGEGTRVFLRFFKPPRLP